VAALKQGKVGMKDEALAELIGQLGTPPIKADSALATLDWHEIERLQRTGLIDFGSHTHTHPILARGTPEQQREELTKSRDVLRERLGKVDLFAYPNGTRGDFTTTTKRLLREAGYRCALATIPGLHPIGGDLYEMPRVNIGAETTASQLEWRLLGL
jgi:peptidoglycan/xylan/chitin deacetylase (PgdA/CDA1 family)